jgi:F-type H+-transporting ATPase subunit c
LKVLSTGDKTERTEKLYAQSRLGGTRYLRQATAVFRFKNGKSVNTIKGGVMDSMMIIAVASIIIAGITIAIGVIAPALGEGRAVATALTSLAQQPDASATITRTLFVGLAMIESLAIYCFVVSMILIFANPFWNHVISQTAGK